MMLSRPVAGTVRAASPAQSPLLPGRIAFSYRPNSATPRPRVASLTTTQALAKDEHDAQEDPQGLRGAQTLKLATIFAETTPGNKTMQKANVILPPSSDRKYPPKEGNRVSVSARGVVLFLHGFAQGPTAYARMLHQLAADGVVVVAPCSSFGVTPEKQQSSMVEAALFWRNLIARNELPGLQLLGDTSANVGFMGHSVGGGLAAYVVDSAAGRGQPFTSAHVMAPQTSKVVKKFKYDTAQGGSLLAGVNTDWGVQYGLIDLLSLAPTVNAFRSWLESKDRLRSTVKYELGTHVGFEDQLVVGGESFTTNVLPWVLAVLWGTVSLWLPWVGLRGLSMLRDDTNVRAAGEPAESKGVEGSIPAGPGFGVPDDVELPDERLMLLGYVLLAGTVTAIETTIPGFAWDTPGDIALSVIKGVFLLLAVGSWPAIVVYPYEAIKQRPEARLQAVQYFRNTLVPPKAPVKA